MAMNKDQFIEDGLIYITDMCRKHSYSTDHAVLMTGLLGFVYDQLNPRLELKVKRTDGAKEFKLIHTKKDGDVGFDLPAVLPFRDEFIDEGIRAEYEDRWSSQGVPYDELWRDMHRCIVIQPGGRGVIPTGLFLEIPEGRWASIEARSSTSKSMLMVPKGVIDEGYRGELFAVLLNVGTEPVTIYHGDRYVQLIIHRRENADIDVVEVDELSQSERGDTGFGSTGR